MSNHISQLNMDPSTAEKGSSINPEPLPEKTSLDELLHTMDRYFKDCSYDCGRYYNDGHNVELLRDTFEISTLLSAIVRIVFDDIRQDITLSDKRKLELALIYESINNLIQILQTDDKNVAHNAVLCKLIGYCMKNYKIYNSKTDHDRPR